MLQSAIQQSDYWIPAENNKKYLLHDRALTCLPLIMVEFFHRFGLKFLFEIKYTGIFSTHVIIFHSKQALLKERNPSK